MRLLLINICFNTIMYCNFYLNVLLFDIENSFLLKLNNAKHVPIYDNNLYVGYLITTE